MRDHKRFYIYLCLLSFFAIIFTTPVLRAAELPGLEERIEKQQEEIDRLRQDLEMFHSEVYELKGETKPLFGANLGLFGDINYSTKSREKAHNGFYLGDVDLYSALSYGDRLNFLLELAIEIQEHASELDLERLWIGYTFNDLLIIRAGKHHTAIGYWNKTYHHGKHLFLTVDRPFFLDFGHNGGILPIHIVGLEFEGGWRSGFARFKYELDVGNGPKINQSTRKLNPNAAFDNDGSKQVALRISLTPSALPGLTVALFGTTFKLDTSARAGLRERIYGVDVAYRRHGLEFLAEYFRLANSDATGDAFYIQLAYSILDDLTPYTRFESLEVDEADPYATNLLQGFDRYQAIAGVRYDIDQLRSSIKGQYRYDNSRDGNEYDVFEMQWSFGF